MRQICALKAWRVPTVQYNDLNAPMATATGVPAVTECPTPSLNLRYHTARPFGKSYQTWFFFKYLTERFGNAFVGRLWSTAVQVRVCIPGSKGCACDLLQCPVFTFVGYGTSALWM